MSNTQDPAPPPALNAVPVLMPQVTPRGTTVVIPAAPGQPQQTITVPPELVSAFHSALQSLPPGTISTLLQKYWGYVLVAVIPLLLTTYQNVKEIWSGPATVAAIKQEYASDHVAVEANVKAVEAVKVQIETLEKKVESTEGKVDKITEKVDRILWSVGSKPPTPEPHP